MVSDSGSSSESSDDNEESETEEEITENNLEGDDNRGKEILFFIYTLICQGTMCFITLTFAIKSEIEKVRWVNLMKSFSKISITTL